MKTLLKYKTSAIGIVFGAMAGYLYYYFIGCSSGSCPITSSPLGSILYGTLWGWILSQSIKKQKKAKQ